MTIDEAIGTLTAWKKTNYEPPLADEINALNMSIEALKTIRGVRPTDCGAIDDPLLGETEAYTDKAMKIIHDAMVADTNNFELPLSLGFIEALKKLVKEQQNDDDGLGDMSAVELYSPGDE